MNIFFQRTCFSIAIVCMVNHTAISPSSSIVNSSRNVNGFEDGNDNGNSDGSSQKLPEVNDTDEDGHNQSVKREDESCDSLSLKSKEENEVKTDNWQQKCLIVPFNSNIN